MGYKKLERTSISFLVVFILIFSQIINVTDSFPDDEKPLEVNTATYGCYDFLIANNEMYVLLSRWLDILDISNPSKPIDAIINETFIPTYPNTITKDENKILFASGDYPATKLEVIEVDEDQVKTKKTANLNCYISKIVLKEEMLYSMALNNETKVFTIHNTTNFENIQLLGSTNRSYNHGHYRNEDIPDYFFIQENICFFITDEGNLAIYQINNTYQISIIKEYNFVDLRNLYFTEEYLFTCDAMGLQIYNYTNVEDLKLKGQYNITGARAVQVRNEIAYLITSDQFVTIDVSNIEEISILDQYLLGNRESMKLMKMELKDNLAIVLTEELFSDAIGYGGYLYIFDIAIPEGIKRIYPKRIPLNHYRLDTVFYALVFWVLPILIVAFAVIIIWRKYRKQRNQETTHLTTDEKKNNET